jgi:hypothetical protein
MVDRAASRTEKGDAAEVTKARLREDLLASMRAKDGRRVRVLRMLIAELDNAQAVPPGERHTRYVVHAFGDRSAEVSRLRLSEPEVEALFAQKLTALTTAADELEQLGRTSEAAELRAEAAMVADQSAWKR